MKFDSEHVRKLKRLWGQLRKEGGAGHLTPVEDPMDQLIEGIFSNYAADARAHAAVSRLRSALVDLNEMRVTPVSEIVEVVGADYPMCRAAAEELVRALSSLFNRTHKMDLMFLKKQSRKGAETFLNRLDGLGAYAKGMILLRCFKAPIVPLDVHMIAFLKKAGCVPKEAAVEDAQKFVRDQIRESEAMSFYVHLKRHAAAHAPRKGLEYRPVTAAVVPDPPPAPAAPPMEATKKVQSASRPHAPSKNSAARKADPAKPKVKAPHRASKPKRSSSRKR